MTVGADRQRTESTPIDSARAAPFLSSFPRVVAARPSTAPSTLAWLAPLGLLATGGLLLVAIADGAARSGDAWAEPLFWLGLLTIFVPLTGRLLLPGPARAERIGLIATLGAVLYLVKVLHSPVNFTFHDEFVHWSNVQNAISTGHLFVRNPVLPVSGDFPGLSSVTAATAQLAGIPIFTAGLIVIGVARLVAVLAIYLLYESVSGSSWVAGIGAALYAANPGFVFFDAQFSYESLALPFAAGQRQACWAELRVLRLHSGSRTGLRASSDHAICGGLFAQQPGANNLPRLRHKSAFTASAGEQNPR